MQKFKFSLKSQNTIKLLIEFGAAAIVAAAVLGISSRVHHHIAATHRHKHPEGPAG